MVKVLIDSMHRRSLEVKQDRLFELVGVLDPHFKLAWVKTSKKRDKMQLLLEEARAMSSQNPKDDNQPPSKPASSATS